MREKTHRLSRAFYRGEVSVAITLCLQRGVQAFTEPGIISAFTRTLGIVLADTGCIVPAYCFMPDHQHVVITGTQSTADTWEAIVRYKQKTGFWMSRNRPGLRWQKDFYDHLIREHEDLTAQVRYVLDNPVRKGLAPTWQSYPYKGSIGCGLEDVLRGIV